MNNIYIFLYYNTKIFHFFCITIQKFSRFFVLAIKKSIINLCCVGKINLVIKVVNYYYSISILFFRRKSQNFILNIIFDRVKKLRITILLKQKGNNVYMYICII